MRTIRGHAEGEERDFWRGEEVPSQGSAFPLQVQHSRNRTKAEEIMRKVDVRGDQGPKAHPCILRCIPTWHDMPIIP